MPKSCHVFTFILVYFLWCLVNEVKCANNDLDFWQPDQRFESKVNVDSEDRTVDQSTVEDETKTYIDNQNDLRRMLETEKNKKLWSSFKKERKEEIMKEKIPRSKHKKPSMDLKESRSTKVRSLQQYSYPSHRSAKARIEESEFISPQPKLRQRFDKRHQKEMYSALMLRSTRMPHFEMQQFVEDKEDPVGKKNPDEKLKENFEEDIGYLSPYIIEKQLRRVAAKFRYANITTEIIGRTMEYNDIVLMKVAEKKRDSSKYFRARESKFINEVPAKKIIFIVHGLSLMGFNSMDCFKEEVSFVRLLSYYFKHLDKFDIFLIPMANPDGVALNFPFWNKNNSPQTHCNGVSLDRNFDVAWNGTRGISSCNQQYPGTTPFTELETQAIRDVFHRYSDKIIAYLHVHAGTYGTEMFKGDAVLYPKGYSDVQTDDDKYVDLRGEIEEAMKNASFRIMSVAVETLHNWYGPVAGTSVDYASTIYGIPYALEVVFQQYETKNARLYKDTMNEIALIEIWQRVFEVIFNHIWKSNSPSNDDT